MNKLRAWHISNLPGKPYYVAVASIEQASLVLRTLAGYDLYLDHLIANNAQGLEVFEDNEWVEWYDRDGNDIAARMAVVENL